MCCVMFVSTLGFLSDGEDKIDSRSAPGNRGGPASAECCRGEFPSSQRGDVREVFLYSLPLMDQRDPLCPDWVCPSPSLAVL